MSRRGVSGPRVRGGGGFSVFPLTRGGAVPCCSPRQEPAAEHRPALRPLAGAEPARLLGGVGGAAAAGGGGEEDPCQPAAGERPGPHGHQDRAAGQEQDHVAGGSTAAGRGPQPPPMALPRCPSYSASAELVLPSLASQLELLSTLLLKRLEGLGNAEVPLAPFAQKLG